MKEIIKAENYKQKMVALYIRVSSSEQAQSGISLDAQQTKLKEFVIKKVYSVYHVYVDSGVSAGIPMDKRPEGSKLISDAKEGKFEAIIIVKFDRAFRNTMDAILTSDLLRELNIDLISLHENIDTTTAMGRFFFTIISSLAQLEREMTAERNDSIRDHKFMQGLMIGKAPIGYKWNKATKQFVIDKRKAEVVKQAFKMTVDKVNWKVICTTLKINPKSYYNLIKNPVYIGIVTFKGVKHKGAHDPLIDEETFYKLNPSAKII